MNCTRCEADAKTGLSVGTDGFLCADCMRDFLTRYGLLAANDQPTAPPGKAPKCVGCYTGQFHEECENRSSLGTLKKYA